MLLLKISFFKENIMMQSKLLKPRMLPGTMHGNNMDISGEL